ncbi:PhoH family protein [Enterococcus faecium]|nr:PhoH family protein [Enterococcus faecium]
MTNHLLKSYVSHLLKSRNLILRGAPGTGKTFLANEMAADVVSNGRTTQINELSEDEKSRIGFVQFHPI